MSTRTGRPAPFHLDHDGSRLELRVVRDGLRTRATLLRDGEPVGEASGLGAVPIPVDDGVDGGEDGGEDDAAAAEEGDDAGARHSTVLVLSPLPGVVARALLLVPRPSGGTTPDCGRPVPAELVEALPKSLARFATSARHEFGPPPGSVAARLAVFRREHPRLWAARHVVLAALKVGFALLGLAAFLRLLVAPLLGWLRGLLPDIDLPDIPWPDIDLPDIPWPDIDLPDLHAPGWLLVLLGTAKFWVPILVAVGVAVVEVRRRRRVAAREDDEGSGTHG
ncbi:hypothetical protein [Pseudonocardia lacus]|uniref:hypothetical protein n=1 Tax=Pseudonocardia lacus TaxID=2835865 RepID=UPI001BDD6C23|nr:hypothetical protein [Pseudonocardia lacus]